MSYWKPICLLILPAAALAISAGQQPSVGSSKGAARNAPGQVVHITLPGIPGEVLPGPGVQVYSNNCLICHSARYVNMQPNFTREVWEKEVRKMVVAYGAMISDADQRRIVEYLVAVRGVPGSK
ncbi:MAG TPA: cytochrome c [Candidatus Binatia bacterium]|nr:cytochrome c [Candidatus Binatia bacterium]